MCHRHPATVAIAVDNGRCTCAARHGFATALLESGADPRLVQDLMGHSTTALLQVYQHIRAASHEQARSMLDQAFGSEAPR